MLALGTFGTDQDARILGMHAVITFEQPMVTQWATQRAAIQAHFAAMQQGFPMPYRQAVLPQVLRSEDVDRGLNLPSPS